uniref:carbonic anhydrase n=1 Tax=Lygus hesperus TaxID=30085 RepID=A0A0A9XAC0_LYGHE
MTEIEVPFERRKKKGEKAEKMQFLSPIDVREKDATKIALGEINFDQMWRPSVCTLITNTGAQLKLELTSPGSMKWKPIGDVSYVLSDVKFFWAFDNYGSCHMIEGKKYALEVDFTFKHRYEVTVSSELLLRRMALHRRYKELANAADEEEKAIQEAMLEEEEADYEEFEHTILHKRYIHSEAKEALSKRKPTKYAIEKPGGIVAGTGGSDDDEADDDDEDDERETGKGRDEASRVNLDRVIKYREERAIHELAARRFAPVFEKLQKKKSSSISDEEVEAFLTGGTFEGERQKSVTIVSPSSTTSSKMPDDPPIDNIMFPTERDRDRERARRANYQEEKRIRELKEEADTMNWIRLHMAELQVKIAVMFEVCEEAPFYSLFSFLPRVTEPYSGILVDGNLLMPFQDVLASPDFYAYQGSRFIYQDEEVVWIVMKTPLPILNEQLWALRNLKNAYGKPMESTSSANMEELNGRKIYFNVPVKKPEPLTCPGKDKCMCELESATDWKVYKSN